MTQPTGPSPTPMSDQDRLVLFEWHAAHYESLDRCMPPTPKTATVGGGTNAITESDWHAITIRFTALRKFYIEKDCKIRMDRVYRSLLALIPTNSALHENLTWLLDDAQWKKALRPFMEIHYADDQADWSVDEWLQMFLYGTAIHADPRRADALQPRSQLPWELWERWIAGGELSAHNQVLAVLHEIREARAKGTIQLPPPRHEIWRSAPPSTAFTAAH